MEFLIILALILLNGVFAMSEIALVSARKANLAAAAKKGSKTAKMALELAEKPEKFLSTVQIGITLIGILTGIYSGEVLSADFAAVLSKWGVPASASYAAAQAIIVVTVTYFTLILGELVPKRLGLAFAEAISKVIAPPMRFLSIVAAPFVWVLSQSTMLIFKVLRLNLKQSGVTEEEIKHMVSESAQSGDVQEVEHQIVERVFSLGDRDVESIMTHRNDLVWLESNADAQTVKNTIKKNAFEIYPVGKGSIEEVIGVAYLKDILNALDGDNFSMREITVTAQGFHEDMKVYAALEEMRSKNLQYGLVYDEFGSVQGLVTLKDILSALLGYAPDKASEPDIIKRKSGGWLVDGQCPFYDFLSYFAEEDLYAVNEYNTLSGLILAVLEHIPQQGEKFEWHGFSFEIGFMDGARIDKVFVDRAAGAASET